MSIKVKSKGTKPILKIVVQSIFPMFFNLIMPNSLLLFINMFKVIISVKKNFMRSFVTDLLVTVCKYDESWPQDAFLLSRSFCFHVLEKVAIHLACNVTIASFL